MQLKVKTPSGAISIIEVEELIDVDGKAYREREETESIGNAIARLTGRIETIETAIFGKGETDG